MSRFRPAAVIATVLAAVAATLALTSPSDAQVAARPSAGQCRNLNLAQLDRASNNNPTVSCAGTHNTLTFAVPRLPSGVSFRGMTARQMSDWGIRLCTPRFWDKVSPVHTLRDRSMYSFGFFIPTAAERSVGARWVRCDLIVFSNGALQPLHAETSARPVLSAGVIPDYVKRCLDVVTGGYYDIACDQSHDMTPYKAFFFKHTGYPTRKQFVAAGVRRCPDADYYTWMSEKAWKLGDHAIVCYHAAA